MLLVTKDPRNSNVTEMLEKGTPSEYVSATEVAIEVVEFQSDYLFRRTTNVEKFSNKIFAERESLLELDELPLVLNAASLM